MTQSEIKFKDVMALGFKRIDSHDQVFIDQYGFDYFIVSKKVMKHLMFDWDCNTHFVTLLKIGKEGHILSKIEIADLDELTMYINFFTAI